MEDLDLDVKVCIMDTIREDDGLAMSSRNAYLNDKERKAAVILFKSLCAAKQMYDQMVIASSSSTISKLSANEIKEKVIAVLQSEPLVSKIQYVSVDSKETMRSLVDVTAEEGAIVSIACQVGSVRLIDNFVL